MCVACTPEFYKGIYQELGVTFPIKIGDFSDLKALPVIKKEAFRSALIQDTLRTRMFKNEDVFSSSTTGSTGQPMTMHFDSECIKSAKKFYHCYQQLRVCGMIKKYAVFKTEIPSKKEEWYQRLGACYRYSW
ncbi:hypothetical protein O9993_04090 [Vibrio lentus]|nr:hypothetical protein [Vibrio lentus]